MTPASPAAPVTPAAPVNPAATVSSAPDRAGAPERSGPDWWQELAVLALLGTDRRPDVDRGSLPGPVAGPAARLTGDPAGLLLDVAALAVSYRRAGPSATMVDAEPDRAPAERAVRAPGRVGALLEEFRPGPWPGLDPSRAAMTSYWCRAVAEAGLVAPDAQLPELLRVAAAQPVLRPAAGLVLGERGRWLAELNPAWAAALEMPDEPDLDDVEGWRAAGLKRRATWLRAARRADPAAARAVLAAGWAAEPWPNRVAFLGLLVEGLSRSDEAFLEAALDEAEPGSRTAAAAVLARLPESAFGDRMRARARALVRRERGLRRHRPVIDVPDQLDPAGVRDGLSDSPAGPPLPLPARRQWWLEQIVAATPLDVWPALLGVGPVEAVGTSFDEFVQAPIRAGWARAAVRQQNREWARAVLGTGTQLLVGELLPLLDDEQFAGVLGERLVALPAAGLEALVGYLGARPGPWPAGLADAVLDWLLERTGEIGPATEPARALLELISFRFPYTDAGSEVAAAAGGVLDDRWRARLSAVAVALSDRSRIHQELR